MMMLELPQDLLEEIFCRVPATSLLQLRLTCKQWNLIFNDSEFSRKQKATKQFRVLTLNEESRVCLVNVNLHNGTPSTEVKAERILMNYDSTSNQVIKINQVFHCDGFLLCTIRNDVRIVVWNPCTGQTKWIQTRKNPYLVTFYDFVLGYSQDNKSCNKSYKILSYKNYTCNNQVFRIYDINSNSWRNLDVTPIPNYHIKHSYYRVSLKGKTYWFAYDSEEKHIGLISFDYTRERFERLRLPYECDRYVTRSISVVKEEKLSVLLQRQNTSRKEIWVTNKIDDETKEMSWTKLLEVEVSNVYNTSLSSFFVDEEKKLVVCSEQCIFESHLVIRVVSIVGEDNKAKQVELRVETMRPCELVLGNYVPSLIQIPQLRRKGKRKRIKADIKDHRKFRSR